MKDETATCGCGQDARAEGQPCCPLPPGVAPLPLAPEPEADTTRLAAVAKALSDPIRLRMLRLMAQASTCCRPAAGQAPEGVCVCEFQELYGLGQSKVSYHVKVLRDAGLVRETRRGKWSFYSIDQDAAATAIAALGEQLGL